MPSDEELKEYRRLMGRTAARNDQQFEAFISTCLAHTEMSETVQVSGMHKVIKWLTDNKPVNPCWEQELVWLMALNMINQISLAIGNRFGPDSEDQQQS
jgi:hypothetical protein